ncbi:hypothetical protein GmHk_12G035058 [Glycine max]|nr:hypothetical protein GmHk_12G035058 [Glycine max]
MASNSQQFSARNDVIVLRGVHDVATDSSSSAENKKLEGKLDALVNIVTQLAINQKSTPVTVARVCGLCSSADHHTDLCPSLQQSGVNEQPEAYAANTYNRPPQQQNQQLQNNYDVSSNRCNPASIQSLTNQMGQMATQLNQALSPNSDKLPSQTVQNSKNLLCIPGQDFTCATAKRRVQIMRTNMTTLTQIWMTLLLSNILPSDHNADLPLWKHQLVCAVMT